MTCARADGEEGWKRKPDGVSSREQEEKWGQEIQTVHSRSLLQGGPEKWRIRGERYLIDKCNKYGATCLAMLYSLIRLTVSPKIRPPSCLQAERTRHDGESQEIKAKEAAHPSA